MSNNNPDWFSILALLVAGGISLIKMWANKSQEKRVIAIPQIPEEEKVDETIVDEYTKQQQDDLFQSKFTFEPTLEGSSYQEEQFSENIDQLIKTEETRGEEHPEFDIRYAIISSEILRRPSY